jgi:hypothetical protein
MVARRVGEAGGSSLTEQVDDRRNREGQTRLDSRRGDMRGASGPSTMTGAVSIRQTRRETAEQNRRIGRIFHQLEQTVERAEIVSNGGSLDRLAQAVRRWLQARSQGSADLDQRQAELIAELSALLLSYD